MRTLALTAAVGAMTMSSVVVGPAFAVPGVVADVAPVHSLVSRVMEGVGAPVLLTAPGTSPHHGSMRPSQASALRGASVIFEVGAGLTPWLEDAVGSLAPLASKVDLSQVPGVETLTFRSAPDFAVHDGDHENSGHRHAHDLAGLGLDPHLWLDPENARAWLPTIAETLAAADPGNAEVYLANAVGADREIAELETAIAAQVAPLRGRPFVVFHDAYHYFEHRFGIEAVGTISTGEAAKPGPATVQAIRNQIASHGVVCVFSEPQFDMGLIQTVIEGTDVRVGTLDPLGVELEPGPELYGQLLQEIADGLEECLADGEG